MMRENNYKYLLRAVIVIIVLVGLSSAKVLHDYGDALSKSIIFFEGQRSGKLPPSQRLRWRNHSALHDGMDKGVSVFLFFFLFSFNFGRVI